MLDRLKRSWHNFRQYPPGKRFEMRYQRRKEAGHGKFRRVASLAGGGFIIAAGLFMLPAPGPGAPILLLGAALLAEGSRPVARALDRLEVRLRKVLHWSRQRWHSAPLAAKGLLVLLALGVAGALGLGAYHVLFGA